jgi:threonine dehydrogenase-like Zn-dependent dehydrogenase
MRALTWHGRHDVRVETVPDPEIVNPRDAILRVTSTAICGSDLHLYDGYIPTLRAGDVLGHEIMGEVVETGPKSTLNKGQRVVVPFTISCGDCFFCKKQQYSACDNSNPAETSDASRLMMGHPMGAEILDYREVDVRAALDEMTGGIGPDAVIDCVGMESHGAAIDNVVDTVKAHMFLATERPHALRQAILACRKGGRVSIPGVYGGFADKFPLGQMMEKGLTIKQGQTHVQKYTKPLLEMIEQGKVDTTFLISHHAPLEQAAEMYRHWHDEQDEYTKIVLQTDAVKPKAEKQEKQHEPA